MEHAQGCEPAPSRAGLGWQEPLLRWALLLPHAHVSALLTAATTLPTHGPSPHPVSLMVC